MKICAITAYNVRLPFVDGPYSCAGSAGIDHFETLVVGVTADDGLTGWGEMAPLGSFYSEAFAAGARAALDELCVPLIGLDPRKLLRINRVMDGSLKGHPYAKSAIDMACCDLAARAANVPLVTQLGGSEGCDDSIPLYRAVPQGEPDEMASLAEQYVREGYRRIQIKVGRDPREDIECFHAVTGVLPSEVVVFCDANGGWKPIDAKLFLLGVRGRAFVLEQPCATLEQCLLVRQVCEQPMVLDELATSTHELLAIHHSGAADGVTLKIARTGGITKTRQLRDLAVDLGLQVTVEDTGGAEIDTAAMAHLSLSTPAESRLHTVDFHNWVTVSTASMEEIVHNGTLTVPSAPGLGVEADVCSFGEPVAHFVA